MRPPDRRRVVLAALPVGRRARFVRLWWAFLTTMAAVNMILLARVFAATWADRTWYTRLQRFLCTLFVVGCASRSFVVRGDVERLSLLDTPLAAVAIGYKLVDSLGAESDEGFVNVSILEIDNVPTSTPLSYSLDGAAHDLDPSASG